MQKYQYTLEPGLDNYYTNVRGELFKHLSSGEYKVMSLDGNASYKVTNLNKVRVRISIEQCILNSRLHQKTINLRYPLDPPYSNYYITRDAKIYNKTSPLTPIEETDTNIVVLLDDNGNLNNFHVLRGVLTTILFPDVTFTGEILMVVNFNPLYANYQTNSKAKNGVYLCKGVLNYVHTSLWGREIRLFKNKPKYCFDIINNQAFEINTGMMLRLRIVNGTTYFTDTENIPKEFIVKKIDDIYHIEYKNVC